MLSSAKNGYRGLLEGRRLTVVCSDREGRRQVVCAVTELGEGTQERVKGW